MPAEGTIAPAIRRGFVPAVALLAGAALANAAAPAHAQEGESAPEGVITGEALDFEDEDLGTWIKICAPDQSEDGQEVCLVTQEVRTDDGEFLASVSVRETVEDENKTLMVAVPPGTLLQPGLRVQVDENDQLPGEYVICLPNACYGELEIEDEFVDEMKAGQNLVISVINNEGEAVGVGLTLVGFTDSWEGEPVDTEELARQRQQLQEQLQRRASDARERLLEEEGEAEGEEESEEAPAE